MKKQKIVLIRPNQIHWKNEAKRVGTPLGLLSIGGTLKNKGYEVDYLDSCIEGYDQEREIKSEVFEFGLSDEAITGRIEELNPDIIGIQSLLTCYSQQALKIARISKQVNPRTIVILGGQHISTTPSTKYESIDHIVCGEGESAILEILANPSISKFVNGQPAQMESLSNPYFEWLNPSMYDERMSFFGKLKGNNFVVNSVSRGCPMACNFCTVSNFSGKKVRYYSLKQVEEQIEKLVKLGFTDYISVDDNILTLPTEFRKQYFSLLNDSKMNWYIDGGVYYALMSKDNLNEIKGCSRVFMPVENYSLKTMHQQNKYLMLNKFKNEEKIEFIIKSLKDLGIQFYSAVMIGFPNETWGSIQRTIDFAERIKEKGALGVGFHWVHPFPGTPFYKENYHLVPQNRKWETNPEYYTLIKPVFPIESISLEEAESEVNKRFSEINQTQVLNNSAEYKPA